MGGFKLLVYGFATSVTTDPRGSTAPDIEPWDREGCCCPILAVNKGSRLIVLPDDVFSTRGPLRDLAGKWSGATWVVSFPPLTALNRAQANTQSALLLFEDTGFEYPEPGGCTTVQTACCQPRETPHLCT